jgi:hypothetical protein
MVDCSYGRRIRPRALGRPIRSCVSGLPERDMERMGTNILVICAASLVRIAIVAIQIALGGIVRCEDCFAKGTLDEGLIDDEAESAVVRVRGQFV